MVESKQMSVPEIKKNIKIERPNRNDMEQINDFFKLVIFDTFGKNSISDLTEIIDSEIENKRKFLEQDIKSHGEERFFLIAKDGDKIVGCIEYGTCNEIIKAYVEDKFSEIIEIGTIFVHPEYQGDGLGSKLINCIFKELRAKNIEIFSLDSGYKSAQKIWTKKFGKPQYLLKNFWGENYDHMIWVLNLSSCER